MADLSRVPEALRREPRWVCWRRVVRGGRATKLPVNAMTGKMADSTDPATWCDFETAVAAVPRWGASGVGFVFEPDRWFTGLDLDHVIKDGRLADAYRWVVNQCHTYVEVSPSGDGPHLIFLGSKPEGAAKSRKGLEEMYDHGRCFTVTGNVFEGHDQLASNPRVVERAYKLWIDLEYGNPAAQAMLPQGGGSGGDGRGNGNARATSPVATGGGMTDDELLERAYASSSGDAIRALMQGDMSAQGDDHSAADMALCSHLAFWCAGDAARIDRIFRSSGLMRLKWDSRRGGTTYGTQTIERAVSNCREFYEPRKARPRGAAKAKKTYATDTTYVRMLTRARRKRGLPKSRPSSTRTARPRWRTGGWTGKAACGRPTPMGRISAP